MQFIELVNRSEKVDLKIETTLITANENCNLQNIYSPWIHKNATIKVAIKKLISEQKITSKAVIN